MDATQEIRSLLKDNKFRWLVTGAAGFIGSHICEKLIENDQDIIAIDNFSTGKKSNIDHLENLSNKFKAKFKFYNIDICCNPDLEKIFKDIDKVVHQAALGSVPRSIDNPLASHDSNVTGFINILNQSVRHGIKRVVYASSSSVYGDSQEMPKREQNIGKVLSPYAATKMCNEVYSDAFANCYDISLVGLRYFNVFGPRQDPEGPYAAVIPKWIDAIKNGLPCVINGDGETSRDFCYVDNVVFANIASSLATTLPQKSLVLNIACGDKTTLNELHQEISKNVSILMKGKEVIKPNYSEFRKGDVRHSLADISKATSCISYQPFVRVDKGIELTVKAYFS